MPTKSGITIFLTKKGYVFFTTVVFLSQRKEMGMSMAFSRSPYAKNSSKRR